MNKDEISFHQSRRAFVIIKDVGIILAKEESPLSHIDLLKSCGIAKDIAEGILDKNPRGYFKDNKLVLYKGEFIPLTEEDIGVVKAFFNDLKGIFAFNEQTRFFNGLKVDPKIVGWPPLYEISLST